MKTQILMSLVLAGSLVSVAQAEEQNQNANSSTVKVSDVQNKEEKHGDIDNEITNAKMRAESGSKSQWSMSADIGFNGGNLETPFSAVRPNYSGDPSTNSQSSIDGTIAGSYRVNKNSRVNFGTGISVLTPFQTTTKELTTSSEAGGATEVSTPYISYGYSGRIAGIQSSASVSYSHATSNYDLNSTKISGSVGGSYTMLFDIENSNFQPGVSVSLGTQIFKEGNPNTYDYYVALYPFAEYAINDMFSLRTVFRPFTYLHMTEADGTTFYRSLYTQSVGLGIAVTRDLYLYPNMQFAPENLKPSLTNVGINMTANLF